MEKILLVEDEVEVANIIAKFLRKKGLIIDIAYDLAGGLEKFIPNYSNTRDASANGGRPQHDRYRSRAGNRH